MDKGIFSSPQVQLLMGGSRFRSMLLGFDKLLYQHIREAIKSVESVPANPPYNPYLYESLLADVGELLDRCLAYRRECQDLEAQAVRRALEYELFNKLSEKQNTLVDLLTDTSVLAELKTAYSSASAEFKSGVLSGGTEKGFAMLYDKNASVIDKQSRLEASKNDALHETLKAIQDHQDLLQTRHTTPGHSLNYAERRDRIIPLIKQDVVEAYQKARAAKAGIKAQLQVESDPSFPFPTISSDENDENDVKLHDVPFLDNFVLWTRSLVSNFERQTEGEIPMEFIIPLTSPYGKVGNDIHGADKAILQAADFSNCMQSPKGTILFSLKDALPSDAQVKNLRLRSIGVSAGLGGQGGGTFFQDYYPSLCGYTWSCFVFLPLQDDPINPGKRLEPNVVRFANVSFKPEETDMASGSKVWNVDPRVREWTIVVDTLVNRSGSNLYDVWPRHSDYLRDLRLHLRLVGLPSPDPATWGTISLEARGEPVKNK